MDEQRIRRMPVASIAASKRALPSDTAPAQQAPPARTTPPANTAASRRAHSPVQLTLTQMQIKTETGLILESRRRIAAIKAAQLPTPTLQIAPRPSRRDRELANAALTGDKKFLKQKSIKLKDEARSDDDDRDIRRELKPEIKTQNFFRPKEAVPTHTKQGYVRSDFVADSSSSSSESEQDEEDDEQEEDERNTDDDDESPDYVQTDSLTPSPRGRRSVPKDQWKAFQAFTKSQQNPAPQATATTSLPGMATADLAFLATVVSQVSQAIRPSTQSATLDAHNRPARDDIPTFGISLTAPTHDNWDDVAELTRVFKPAYDKYRASCGNKHYDTIWETYTPTQRTRVSRFLTKTDASGHHHDYSEAVLAALSNDEFVDLMCKKKGYSTTMQTEAALRKITLREPVTSRGNWTNYEVDWTECLAQASRNGTIDAKRLTVIFREGIPDDYFQTNLKQQNFKTWRECLTHMQAQIDNAEFIIPWKEACSLREEKKGKQNHQAGGGAHQAGGGAAQVKSQPQQPPARPAASGAFDPLTWKNSYGTLNVNPNFILDLDQNKDKTPCDRCNDGTIHKWNSSLCTSYKDKKNKEIAPKLPSAEVLKRQLAKWSAGFFAAKDPALRAAKQSPSAQESVAASAATVDGLKNVAGKK